MFKKILSFLDTYKYIILISIFAGILIYNQSVTNAVQRRLLERNYSILLSDITDIKAEQRKLAEINNQLVIHATKIDEWINKYGAEIDKLGQLNTENRRELNNIRNDIGVTKTELSNAIAGLKVNIESLKSIQSINTDNAGLYNEIEQRLRELAERYGVNLK